MNKKDCETLAIDFLEQTIPDSRTGTLRTFYCPYGVISVVKDSTGSWNPTWTDDPSINAINVETKEVEVFEKQFLDSREEPAEVLQEHSSVNTAGL